MSDNTTCDPPAQPLRWLVLGLVAVGTFMATLDISIVTVAMPTLTAVFKTTVATSQWFVLSYTLVITILLLTCGRLGDLIGRRRLYIYGILVFTAGSLACGLSVSAGMLILARALQGVGSAMTMSAGPAMIAEAFPAAGRGRALGLIGTAVAFGLLAGPLLGGVLVEYAGWRWMFFLNLPVGAVLAAVLAARVRGFDTHTEAQLDILGAVLMGAATAALILGLTYGDDLGWGSPSTTAVFALALAAGVGFVLVEKRASDPMLDLALFRNRGFVIGAFTGWTNYAAIIPVSVFIPFYLQNSLRFRPDQVGLILASGPLTLAFVAPIAGSLSDRIGFRALTSVGLLVAGCALLSMRTLTPDSTCVDVVLRLVLASSGSAMFVSPNSSAVMGSVTCESLGIAAGTIALARNLGMVCGVALAGAIITTVQRGFFIAPVPQHYAFLVGLRSAFLAGAIICFVGSFVSTMRTGAEASVLRPPDTAPR